MILLLFIVFPLFINSQILKESDINNTEKILSSRSNKTFSFVDSIENIHLKLVLKEIKLKQLIEENNIAEIKKNFNLYDSDFEQAVKRSLALIEDTSYISYFKKLGYKVENKIYDRKKIKSASYTDKVEYIKKYPSDGHSVILYFELKDSLPETGLESFLLSNMRNKNANDIFATAGTRNKAEFLSALINGDTAKISSLINSNIEVFKKTDRSFKIKYSIFIDDSARDSLLNYFIGRNYENKKEFKRALECYIKAGDEEAILRMIASLKNICKTDRYADSILLFYNASSAAFLYHRAKFLVIKNRKKESDSIFEYLSSMFPQNFYSIRASLYLGKNYGKELYKKEIDSTLVKLFHIFMSSHKDAYFDRFIFRIVSAHSINEKDASFLMKSLNRNNLAIYFAEKYIEKHGFSFDIIDNLYPVPYLDVFRKYAVEEKIDPAMLLAIAREESSFNPDAISSANAMGMMQLMDFTYGEYYKDKDYFNIEKNISAGAKHLSSCMRDFPDNPAEWIMSYNAGKGNVKKWKRLYIDWELFLESVPFIETKNYVKKVLRSYFIYKFIVKVS